MNDQSWGGTVPPLTTVRVTARWLDHWTVASCRERFPQGTVLRFWIGPLFVKVRWPRHQIPPSPRQ